ncbi:MAG: response regulator transcription factor [Eubacterium sp.]|nr:response regulator transcription factor [Eubacterium sp.]MCI9538337.1 response regulator transcription factor [Eubacterium sp.]
MIKILIVEDEVPISNLISMSLEKAGYQCECVFDGMEAADKLEEEYYDLVLLDIMLPKVDGYELMEYIQPMGIPVIFLTAKSNVEDTVKGLEMGAEDYLTKPFEIVELLARVEVVLRRYDKNEQYLRVEEVEVDTRSRTVKKDKKVVRLTNKEYELLIMFIKNKNIALFRDVIYERIWEKDYTGESRTVDLHVQRLKRKLGWEEKIKTIYKIGYRLEV